MSNLPSKNKIVWIEILRVVACFAVVLLHVSSDCYWAVPPSDPKWVAYLLGHGLTRFAVPTFIMISGMLYLNPARNITFKKLYTQYLFKNIVMYCAWAVIYSILEIYVFKNIGEINDVCIIKAIVKYSISKPKYHLWYLATFVGLLFVVPILKAITESPKSKELCEYIIILFLIFKVGRQSLVALNFQYANYIDKIFNLFSPEMVCNWIGFLILGYYLYTYDISKPYSIIIYILGIMGISAGLFVCYRYSNLNGKAIPKYYANFSVYSTIFAIAVFLFFKNQFQSMVFSDKVTSVINKISGCTLGIYLIHPFFRDVFAAAEIDQFILNEMFSNAWIALLTLTILVFIASFGMVCILKRIPVVRKWLIG